MSSTGNLDEGIAMFIDACCEPATATLMQKLGLRLRLPEVGDRYGVLFLESFNGSELAAYDMIERKLRLQHFNNLTVDFFAAPWLVQERLNEIQLRTGRLHHLLQACDELFTQQYPKVPPEFFGNAWALTVSHVNHYRGRSGPIMKFWECLELAYIYPTASEEDVKDLIAQHLPVAAIEGLRADLHPDLLHDLYGTAARFR